MILPDACPKCKVSLLGPKAGEWDKAIAYSDMQNWSRVQLIVDNGKAVCFKCPDCKGEWDIPWLRKEPKAQDLP